MFEKSLKAKVEKIFGIKKVTFDAPNYGAPEQDCIFIEITDAIPRMIAAGGGRQTARVSGALICFSQGERLPWGFFAKRIEQADPELTRGFFFLREVDVPDSPARMQNIHERRQAFVFLYDAQYDPDRGSMTTFESTIEISE